MASQVSQLPGVQVISESVAPVNGFIHGCGQAAYLMMAHIVRGDRVDPNELSNLIKLSVVSGHRTDIGGSTRPQDLQWLAETQGIKTRLGGGASWRSTSDDALASGRPVVVGVGNATAFGGADRNVKGHYVTLVGKTDPNHYIVADPNQPQAKSGETVVYSASQIQAARPFATLAPVSATQQLVQGAAMGSENTRSDCQYSVSLFPGNTTCLDPFVDGLIRFALIGSGIVLLVMAVLIFTRKEWAPLVGDAAKGAGAAAAA